MTAQHQSHQFDDTSSPRSLPRLNKQERAKLGYLWSWWIGDMAELVKAPILGLKHHLKKDIQYHPQDQSLLRLFQTLDHTLFTALMEFGKLIRYIKWWGRCIFDHEVWGDPLPDPRQHPRPDYPVILTALRGLVTATRRCLAHDCLPRSPILPHVEAILRSIIKQLKQEDWKTPQTPFGRRPLPPIQTSLRAFLAHGDDDRP